MPIPARESKLTDSLNTLKQFEVPVKTVLDVGVFHGTIPLKSAYPELEHYLFEPVASLHPIIHEKYEKFHYKLFDVALSDRDGIGYKIDLSKDLSGRLTNYKIVDDAGPWKNDERVIAINPIHFSTLDSIMAKENANAPFLLKIDVDGSEMAVLNGARKTLEQSSIVVIETTRSQFSERYNFLEQRGFELFDIVDACYYSGTLWQVDLVFLRRDLFKANEGISQSEMKSSFDRSQWHSTS
jgi:FkbM family methyltransferase